MLTFPISKINLGLYVTAKRPDGMHDLSTVFLPIPLKDNLEIVELDKTYTADLFHLTGTKLPGGEGDDNLVMKTVRTVREKYDIPFVEIWLHKRIPTGAGLGGGSSDAAFAMKMLNDMFDLRISDEEANETLAKLGADCPFFWKAKPAYAEGIGEILEPIDVPQIKGLHLALVKPDIHVSTREAFGGISPKSPDMPLKEALKHPIEQWQTLLGNDFERTVFPLHPEIAAIKQTLVDAGAIYAQMSGSGSSVFAFFKHNPQSLVEETFKDCFTFSI